MDRWERRAAKQAKRKAAMPKHGASVRMLNRLAISRGEVKK